MFENLKQNIQRWVIMKEIKEIFLQMIDNDTVIIVGVLILAWKLIDSCVRMQTWPPEALGVIGVIVGGLFAIAKVKK